MVATLSILWARGRSMEQHAQLEVEAWHGPTELGASQCGEAEAEACKQPLYSCLTGARVQLVAALRARA
jgi:hypothetical protein